MNKDRDEALSIYLCSKSRVTSKPSRNSVICANDVLLRCIVKRQGDNLRIGAQNMHYEESGAFTGETSPKVLENTGLKYVIIGHSERRQMLQRLTNQLIKTSGIF